MPRSFKWQPYDGARHAVPQSLALNDIGRSLCDREVMIEPNTWSSCARFWPTCTECDRAWRAAENILPWPREEDSATDSRADTSVAENNDLVPHA